MKEYKGWFWDSKTQDFYRWKDLPENLTGLGPSCFWSHFCLVENRYKTMEEDICPACRNERGKYSS